MIPNSRVFLYKIFTTILEIFIKHLQNQAQICIVQKSNDMKTMVFMVGLVTIGVEGGSKLAGMNSRSWYLFGAFIAFSVLAYLVYSLIKPEKF